MLLLSFVMLIGFVQMGKGLAPTAAALHECRRERDSSVLTAVLSSVVSSGKSK